MGTYGLKRSMQKNKKTKNEKHTRYSFCSTFPSSESFLISSSTGRFCSLDTGVLSSAILIFPMGATQTLATSLVKPRLLGAFGSLWAPSMNINYMENWKLKLNLNFPREKLFNFLAKILQWRTSIHPPFYSCFFWGGGMGKGASMGSYGS